MADPSPRSDTGPSDAFDRWAEARLAAHLLAVDPGGLGGVWLRSPAGLVRDSWLATLRAALPSGPPIVRIPAAIGDERLLGGLDLTATLASGRPVAERGILAASDGGIVVLPMAERCPPCLASRLTAVLDTGDVAIERDGFAMRQPARISMVALDEGSEPDESAPPALTERLAIALDLGPIAPRDAAPWLIPDIAAARARLAEVTVPEQSIAALCATALAFGVGSLRLSILAARVARVSAALGGRREVGSEDAALAARLVLAPRATQMPAEAGDAPLPDQSQPDTGNAAPDRDADRDCGEPEPTLDDILRDAVAAAIPAGLLATLQLGTPARGRGGRSGSGSESRSRRRGRPAGTLRGEPKQGARLALVETLRAAAPWQALRRQGIATGRLAIRRDDLRVTRFKQRSETTTVFVVDASGSSAFHRLAEAKGAVELMLAECYVRRDRVALLAFRGTSADLILPPTRSLTRAKRSLAALAAGGGTPLAAAIDAAGATAQAASRAGGDVVLVFMTDGRANVGLDGQVGREQALADAQAAARRLRASRVAALLIDISPRASETAAAIARAMQARYLPLPFADAAAVSDVVRREAAAAGRRSG